MAATLRSLGEEGLLARIYRRFARQRHPSLVLGPGDDAALARLKPGRLLVATHDDQVEGTHFERRWVDFRRLGHRLLRVNLSDLAAMGAVEPIGVLAAAGFPPGCPRRWALDFLEGLAEDAAHFGVPVLGGNLARSKQLFFSLTALGQAKPSQVLKRSGARPGEILAGLGPVGHAAEGLRLLRAGRKGAAVRAFWEPEPQLTAAWLLAECKLASSLIDNSDGLLRSCALLAEASGVGLRLDLPLPAGDGEDYGLVFTAPKRRWAALKRALPKAYRLGETVARAKGAPLKPAGFDHFAKTD